MPLQMTLPGHLENLFERQVSDQENELFSAIPSEDEVLAVIKQISNKKAPGLDRMTALLYSHYWNIIKREVINTVQNFF